MELSSDEDSSAPALVDAAPLPTHIRHTQEVNPAPLSTPTRAPAATATAGKGRARHFQKTNCSMFVSNLHPNITEALLAELLSYAGLVEDVFIPADTASGQSRNFGFVEFFDESAVVYAQHLFDGLLVFQQPIRVKPALS